MAHFVVERFDRLSDKSKPYHYASLCGLLLRDYREKHSASYEDYLGLTAQLTQDNAQMEQAFKRALFNVFLRNQDDHTKNFGFLMDHHGVWMLAPAFDLNYVYDFGMAPTHQMTTSDVCTALENGWGYVSRKFRLLLMRSAQQPERF